MESDGGNTLLDQNMNELATRLITRTQNSTLQTLKRNYAKGKTRLWDGKLYPKFFLAFFVDDGMKDRKTLKSKG